MPRLAKGDVESIAGATRMAMEPASVTLQLPLNWSAPVVRSV
jgi:hypothetical protein